MGKIQECGPNTKGSAVNAAQWITTMRNPNRIISKPKTRRQPLVERNTMPKPVSGIDSKPKSPENRSAAKPSLPAPDTQPPPLRWSMEEVVFIVSQHYKALVLVVHAVLAVCATMALKGRTKPLSLMFEGGSGSGKTAVLQMLFSTTLLNMARYVYRSDKFTPRSFVTHAANVKESDLAKIDMLPQLKDKVLVCKELAPIFRGREEEMRENFSTLISVLDGKGFTSNTGMRGKRGYENSILFIGSERPRRCQTAPIDSCSSLAPAFSSLRSNRWRLRRINSWSTHRTVIQMVQK
jgi:hypothetical protein